MTRCKCGKKAEEGRDECFLCRVSGVAFTFRGGGGYGREAFHNMTNAEKKAEILGDKIVGRDVVPASEFGF